MTAPSPPCHGTLSATFLPPHRGKSAARHSTTSACWLCQPESFRVFLPLPLWLASRARCLLQTRFPLLPFLSLPLFLLAMTGMPWSRSGAEQGRESRSGRMRQPGALAAGALVAPRTWPAGPGRPRRAAWPPPPAPSAGWTRCRGWARATRLSRAWVPRARRGLRPRPLLQWPLRCEWMTRGRGGDQGPAPGGSGPGGDRSAGPWAGRRHLHHPRRHRWAGAHVDNRRRQGSPVGAFQGEEDRRRRPRRLHPGVESAPTTTYDSPSRAAAKPLGTIFPLRLNAGLHCSCLRPVARSEVHLSLFDLCQL